MMTTVAAGRLVTDAGDFAGVYAAHHPEALRLAYLLCGDAHRAEDTVADVFVKVYRQTRRGAIACPRAYIRRAVVNEVNSRFRRLALERREARRRWGDDRGTRAADEQLADADQVFTALRSLPQRQRTAVVLRYYADLSEADAAAAMGVSVGTVKSSVSRGLDRLRTLLGQEVT
ncbi:MAG: SigE family RNA polymerase sigma factor [Euzebyales bacterium]|nr:SigE family RNA polymerase sigma factor [Euzebyales bacterium]